MLGVLIIIFIIITIIAVYRQEKLLDKYKNLTDRQKAEISRYEKIIDKMAEQLTTDYHDKIWVIRQYMEEVDEMH